MPFDLRHSAFRSLRDIGLFLTSARSDALQGGFDQVVVADTIYYLPPPIEDPLLKRLAAQISRLLIPDGVLLLVNHHFPMPNAQTRLTRRIHAAFQWSPALTLVPEYRRAFSLASVLRRSSALDRPPDAARAQPPHAGVET